MPSSRAVTGMDRTSVEVLATVAHEFRNALTPLKGYLSVLARDGAEANGDRAEGYRVMLRQADRLERLVADLLAASTISSGRVPVALEPVDLMPLVREQVEESRRASGRTMHLRSPTGPVEVVADPLRVLQVVVNLLGNAHRFSPPSEPITVSVAATADRAIVSVRDEGPGVPVEEQDRLFEPFGVADGAGGTGLGLFVSRSLVRAMGGQLWMVSRPGRGSTFSFSLHRPNEPQ
jgi:signal transduction histidine kinase